MSQIASTSGVDGMGDIERAPAEPSQKFPGYLQVSNELTQHDDLAAFRMFGDLNMLNLLTLQAELTELRYEFIALASDGHPKGFSNHKNYNTWYIAWPKNRPADFSGLYGPDDELKSPERVLLEKIRLKLKEYSECTNEKLGMPFSNSFFRYYIIRSRSSKEFTKAPSCRA
jgi:hypothetical protein